MKPNDAAIRKRTQIAKANRTMFLWIAVASVIVGAAIVVSIFLTQKLVYTEKVLAAKQETVTRLAQNNEVVDELANEIRVLDTNSDLASAKANEDDQAIQVILDALPSEANSLALGASLQNKLLSGIQGLDLELIQVDPVIGVELITTDVLAPATEDAAATSNAISFRVAVKGNDGHFKKALQNIERSIRTIQITSVRIETDSGTPMMTLTGLAFYEPTKSIELRDKVVPK